jgi:hypothetical protein
VKFNSPNVMAALHLVPTPSSANFTVRSGGEDGHNGLSLKKTSVTRSVNCSLCNCSVTLYSVARVDCGPGQSGDIGNRFSTLHSYRQSSAQRNGLRTSSRIVNTGLRFGKYLHCNAPPARSVIPRANLGGDGDVDIYGDAIDEDYYSVLGLVCFELAFCKICLLSYSLLG